MEINVNNGRQYPTNENDVKLSDSMWNGLVKVIYAVGCVTIAVSGVQIGKMWASKKFNRSVESGLGYDNKEKKTFYGYEKISPTESDKTSS